MWPVLEKALNFLRGRGWLASADLNLISSRATIDGMWAWGMSQKEIERVIGSLLQQSIAEGWSADEWRAAVRDRVGGVFDYQVESLGRTYVKQSYLTGQDELLKDNPVVADVFSHYIYYSTRDGRTRPTHAAMDGKIARRGSLLAATMEQYSREYNCRCSLILITEDDARSRGWQGD